MSSCKAADVISAIGCSFTDELRRAHAKGQDYIHATLDPTDLNKDVVSDQVLIGDAALTLDALVARVRDDRREDRAGAAKRSRVRSRGQRRSGWTSGCRSSPRANRRCRPTG